MNAPRRSTAAIFAAPLALALLSAAGLASALFGDGLWDAVSWLALGLPIVATACFMLRHTDR